MDLDTKIRLMKDLIKENIDITIGEYWDTVNEIESVEKHMSPYLQTTAGIIQVPGYGVVIVNNKSK
jgi:hypothetical protein